MTRLLILSRWRSLAFVALALLSAAASQAATKPSQPPANANNPIQILPGTSSKEPISIDADKLVYFDKEKKAIYSGNVVVIQGDTKMTCSVMTVYLDHSPEPGKTQSADEQAQTRLRPGGHRGIRGSSGSRPRGP